MVMDWEVVRLLVLVLELERGWEVYMVGLDFHEVADLVCALAVCCCVYVNVFVLCCEKNINIWSTL